MNEHEAGFRTQIVGGFQRDDVLRYIEQTSRTYTQKIESLERALDQSSEELKSHRSRADELDSRNEELNCKDAELLERLGAMTLTEDSLRSTLAETQASLDVQTKEAQRLAAENAALREEKEALAGELAELRRKCREYEAAKEHMAEIELRAYRHAKEIERKSQEEAERVKGEASAIVDQLRQRLSTTGESYRAALRRAQDELAEMYQRGCALADGLEAAAGQLDKRRAKPEGSCGRGVFGNPARKG